MNQGTQWYTGDVFSSNGLDLRQGQTPNNAKTPKMIDGYL
jgi:hypothetical protein